MGGWRTWCAALAALFLLSPSPGHALEIRFLPRAQDAEVLDPAGFNQLTVTEAGESAAGLADPAAPAGPGEETVPGALAPPTEEGATSAPVADVAAGDQVTAVAPQEVTTGEAQALVDAGAAATPLTTGELPAVIDPIALPSEIDFSQFTLPDQDFAGFVEELGPGLLVDQGEFGLQPDAPAAAPPPLIRSGTGSGVTGFGSLPAPGGAVPKPELHASLRESVGLPDIAGDRTRATKDPDENHREDIAFSYDAVTRHGVQLRNQIALRTTDDLEVFGTGNQVRFEGSFLEAARPGDFIVRIGDVLPQFSALTLAHNGDGIHAGQEFRRKNGVLSVQAVTARTVREQAPGTFRRNATGLRVANLWNVGKRGRLGVGGQLVHMKEFESSITGAPAVAAFPDNDVGSVNVFFDSGSGLVAEAESAGSTADVRDQGVQSHRRGWAKRQSLAYNRNGKSLLVEHERIEPTFDAPDSAASSDIDRQSVAFGLPVGKSLTATGNFTRTLNDLRRLLGRSIDNKTWRLGLQSRPFLQHKNRWLSGLSMGAAGALTRNESSDATTDHLVREYTYSVGEQVGRLTLTYEMRDTSDLDLVTFENGRLPHHSSYQAGYELSGGKRRPWRASPFFNLGHDHDRILANGAIDRGNQLSVGVNGSVGTRTNFTVARDEQISRFVSQSRQSLVKSHRAECAYQLDPKRGTQANLQLLDQENLDTQQAALEERRVLVSLFQRW